MSNKEYTPYTNAEDSPSSPMTSEMIDVAVFNNVPRPIPYTEAHTKISHLKLGYINKNGRDPAAIVRDPRNSGIILFPK